MIKVHPPTFWAFLIAVGVITSSLLVMTRSEAVDCEAVRAQYQCPVEKHKLHLSFDDGVGSVTDKVLDVLKQENIKATFLILGNKVDCSQTVDDDSSRLCQQRVETLKRIKREGHDIGSHSYQHYRHTQIPATQMRRSINKSKQILAPYFTTEPPVFRLPYGDGWFNQKDKPEVMQALKDAGFFHLGWEMTAYDWNEKFQNGDLILDNVMGQMCGNGKRGRDGVVLFHDGVFEKEHEGRLFTANNLARWIPKMRCAADFKSLVEIKKNLKKK